MKEYSTQTGLSTILLAFALSLLSLTGVCSAKIKSNVPVLQMKDRSVSVTAPGFHNAIYLEKKGTRLLSGNRFSEDNGRTWTPYTYKPDFYAGLPYGYRCNRITSAHDLSSN